MATQNTDDKRSSSFRRILQKIWRRITVYGYLLPSLIAITLFVFVPLFFSFIMSIFRNPTPLELRLAFNYYSNDSNLWWRNLSDFFTANTGDSIGILRNEGIYLIIYFVSLVGFSFIIYKLLSVIIPTLVKLAFSFVRIIFSVLLDKQVTNKPPIIPGFFIAVFSVPITVIVTPVILFFVVYVITLLPVFIKLPIEGYRVVLTSSEIEFFRILFNTVFWTSICVVLHVVLGMILAILMNRGSSSAQGLFRGIFILPWAIPSFVSALVWRAFVFNRRQGILGQITANEGGENLFIINSADLLGILIGLGTIIIVFLLINHWISALMPKDSLLKYILVYGAFFVIAFIGIDIISLAGTFLNSFEFLKFKILDIPTINSTFWFTDDVYLLGIRFKMITFSAILTNVWLGVPFMMVSFLAALQSIPRDLYEAADIDGAGTWNKFRNITLPLLKPTLMTVSLLGIIWTFNLFNVFYIFSQNQTGLGDRTNYDIFVTFIYEQFNIFNYNGAAALSFTVFLMLVSFSLVYRKVMKAEAIFEGE